MLYRAFAQENEEKEKGKGEGGSENEGSGSSYSFAIATVGRRGEGRRKGLLERRRGESSRLQTIIYTVSISKKRGRERKVPGEKKKSSVANENTNTWSHHYSSAAAEGEQEKSKKKKKRGKRGIREAYSMNILTVLKGKKSKGERRGGEPITVFDINLASRQSSLAVIEKAGGAGRKKRSLEKEKEKKDTDFGGRRFSVSTIESGRVAERGEEESEKVEGEKKRGKKAGAFPLYPIFVRTWSVQRRKRKKEGSERKGEGINILRVSLRESLAFQPPCRRPLKKGKGKETIEKGKENDREAKRRKYLFPLRCAAESR